MFLAITLSSEIVCSLISLAGVVLSVFSPERQPVNRSVPRSKSWNAAGTGRIPCLSTRNSITWLPAYSSSSTTRVSGNTVTPHSAARRCSVQKLRKKWLRSYQSYPGPSKVKTATRPISCCRSCWIASARFLNRPSHIRAAHRRGSFIHRTSESRPCSPPIFRSRTWTTVPALRCHPVGPHNTSWPQRSSALRR